MNGLGGHPAGASAALVALAYLAGSIPFGLLITRAVSGQDVRAVGSGNIGATNVARAAGRSAAALTLLLDALKGLLPVLLAAHLTGPEGGLVTAACAIAAVLGHCFPVWLRFRGGKGVATAAPRPAARATLVAPMLPEPMARTSLPVTARAMSSPKGIEPAR